MSQKLPPIVAHGHAIQARFDGAAGGGLTCETHIHIGCATRRHRLLLPDGVWTNLYSPSSRSPPASWPMSGCSASTGSSTRHRSEEHTSELQSLAYLVCRLLLEKKKKYIY